MAEEVEMTPVAAEPPKVNPFETPGESAAEKPATVAAKPRPTVALKPGLKLPTKPGVGATQTGLKPGLKLPPKPGATVSLKPGLKLPTQTALKPGLKLPTKPVIRKPGSTVVATPLPKPVVPAKTVVAPAAAPAVAATPEKPVAPAAAPTVQATPVKPVAIDAQGVGKLPTVDMKAVDRADAVPAAVEMPKPIEQLKSVTQKLKGITQEIPQQAILRKTGIIADGAMSEAQKEAAKHKTARISLSEAMGVAPVKNESAPMKTIRIKRPIDIPNATSQLTPQPKAQETAATVAVPPPAASEAETKPATATTSASTITQRKTLKIARPGGGAVRPSGKFGVKSPTQAVTVPKIEKPAGDAAGAVADIADIPEMPAATVPNVAVSASDGPAWPWVVSTIIQVAACAEMAALAWFLYQNTQTNYF